MNAIYFTVMHWFRSNMNPYNLRNGYKSLYSSLVPVLDCFYNQSCTKSIQYSTYTLPISMAPRSIKNKAKKKKKPNNVSGSSSPTPQDPTKKKKKN